MMRFAVVISLVMLAAGCRAPMPNCNMFGPYGATRVPPPPTGGYGTPQPYYAPPATTAPTTTAPTSAPVGTGFRPAQSNRWSNIDNPAVGPIAREDSWQPTRPSGGPAQVVDLRNLDVALASHETEVPRASSTSVVERQGPIRILPPDPAQTNRTSSNNESPRLRGMVVNDVTRPVEPQPFVPSGRVIDISELPDAPLAVTRSGARTATATSASTTNAATVLDAGWKSRTTTLRVAGN